MKKWVHTYDGPGGQECGYWEEEDPIYPLLREFFFYMDATEESNRLEPFHPNQISSCRANDANALELLMIQMKAKLESHSKEYEQ